MLLATLAAHTKHIGLVSTIPALYGNPATVAREIASLDHVSKGRAAWNVITSQGDEVTRMFGLDSALSQAAKYDKAEEHVVAAQFSVPFVVALSTATGRTSLADFDQPAQVPDAVKALFARVHVLPHEGSSEADRLVFHYRDGAVHEESTAGARLGHPTNPVSRGQTGEKLRDCISFAGAPWSADRVDAVLSAALGIEALPSTSTLTTLLRV